MSIATESFSKYERMLVAAKASRPPRVSAPPSLIGNAYSADDHQATTKAKKAYQLNTGWSFAAIRPCAVRVARQPFRVGKVIADPIGKDWRKEFLPEVIKGQLSEYQTIEVQDNHVLLDMMCDPNEFMTEWCLKYVTAFSIQLTSRAFWWMVESKRNKWGVDVWPVPSHWVTRDEREPQKYWRITPYGQAEGYRVPVANMAYFYYPDPSDPLSSRGPMDAARPASETSEMIRTAQRATFDNLAAPAVIFHTGLVPGEDGTMQKPELSKTQKEQIEFSLRQLYRGAGKWGRMMITDRVIDKVEYLSSKPTEMDFPESGKMTKEEIMQIFGVNPIVAGQIENANRASATVAIEGFLDNVVNPLLTMMSQVLNQWVMPLFGDNKRTMVWIEEARAVDPDGRRADLELLAKWGGTTVDEMRAELGKPPLPNEKGAVIIRPLNVFMEPIDGPLAGSELGMDDDEGFSPATEDAFEETGDEDADEEAEA